MSHNQPFDASIPLLTEVLGDEDNATASFPETPQHVFQPTQSPLPTHLVVPGQPGHAEPWPAEPVIDGDAAGNRYASPAPAWQPSPAPAAPVWAGPDAQQLEQQITQRVLQQLQGNIERVLEQALQDSIGAVLQRSVINMAEEIRAGLQHTLHGVVSDAVNQAVSAELAHIQNP